MLKAHMIEEDDRVLDFGDEILDFRGEVWTFLRGTRAKEPGHSGKVMVRHAKYRGLEREFYDTVFPGLEVRAD